MCEKFKKINVTYLIINSRSLLQYTNSLPMKVSNFHFNLQTIQ